MAKLFIIGIGGTGARVIRAFTMLAAAGVKIGNYSGVYPIIIDSDETNEDKQRTITLLKKYMDVHGIAGTLNDGQLFGPKIKNIKELLSDSSSSTGLRDFQFSMFYGAGSAFKHHIQSSTLSRDAGDLVRLLFSDRHLKLDLEKGFYGNPNIGVTVLNTFEKSDDFQLFARNFNTDDRIFLIGSVFGGTGASGFPLLVKTFRNPVISAGANALQNALIGAAIVLPYFNVAEEGNVSSNFFVTKAKAALSYYEKNMDKVNDVYYIGDQSNFAHPYSEGGSSQKNCAHLVEMIAATSIFEFANKQPQFLTSDSFNEYFFNDNNQRGDVNLFNLGQSTQNLIAKPLTKLFFLLKLHEIQYYEKNDPWFTDKNLTADLFLNGEGKYLKSFLELYREWLNEVGKNDRKFKPFNLDTSDFENMVVNMPKFKPGFGILPRFLQGKFDQELFHSRMNDNGKQFKSNGLPYYIGLYDKSSAEIIDKLKISR